MNKKIIVNGTFDLLHVGHVALLEYAKSLGDLSENAEYHQAREDQGKLEERIVYYFIKNNRTLYSDLFKNLLITELI